MAGPVGELDGILQSMLNLKPPGVTQSKISSVTALCNSNIQSETVLIQRIYTHFKKAPASHKLGVLYVVDSVTRGWVEQARKNGQALGPNEHPADGTFAAGHKRVTELLPSFMNDITNSAPEDQKARISKLIDIWDRSGTFHSDSLSSFRQKLVTPKSKVSKTTTPPGSPPKDFTPLKDNPNTGSNAAQPHDTSSILQALANMAKTNANASGQAPQGAASNVVHPQTSYGQNTAPSVNQASSVQPFPPAVNAFGAASGGINPYGGMGSASMPQTMPQTGGPMNMHTNHTPQAHNSVPSPEQLQQQVQIIQMLQQQGIPHEQWGPVLQAVMAASAGAGGVAPAAQQPQNQNHGQNQYGSRDDPSRAHNGYGMRSPSGRYSRSRSRSPPGYGRRRDDSPRRRRDSPSYGAYGRGADRSNRNAYRRRSPEPDRRRRSDSPGSKDLSLPASGPKEVTFDNSIPADHIKVLSRTLFVGGVTCGEDALRKIFDPFGVVQTCIVNVDKRHAFVKMVSRKDAIAAKEGMERYRGQEMQLRTRWGVGFGPRDCSDYSSGISVIPIQKLTDADRKWMLTAEYGGTGGKALEGGMVVEEPDIEIGAGVSSKAISRRMGTDKSGPQGPRSNREQQQHNDRYRQDQRRDDPHQNINQGNTGGPANASSGPPGPNAGFPFNLFQMPNGFQLPPGFPLPGSLHNQPPPPGAT